LDVAAITELIRLTDALIFDLEDAFARARGVRGRHPRPLGNVKFLLVAQFVNGVRHDFSPPREMIVKKNPSGYHLCFGLSRTANATGRRGRISAGDEVERRVLVEGTTYVVRIESDFYQLIEHDDIVWPVIDPHEPYFFDLQPGYAYPFPEESRLGGGLGSTLLRGALLAPGGEGIAGARIGVQGGTEEYRTDQTGQWVLVFPDDKASGNLTLEITQPGAPVPFQVPNVLVVQGRETGLPLTVFKGRVVNASGVGIGGATIEIDVLAETARTRSDGSWLYYFPPGQAAVLVAVTARLPHGRSQTQSNIQVQPRQTTPVAVFHFS